MTKIQKCPPFKLDSSFRFWLASVLRICLQLATKLGETLHPRGTFWHFTAFKWGKYKAFPPLSPPCKVVSLLKLPIENMDSFILWRYLIWVGHLNNFVADCSLKGLFKSNFSAFHWMHGHNKRPSIFILFLLFISLYQWIPSLVS